MQSVTEIAASVRHGGSTSAAVEAALARIDALDSEIKAWVEVDREGALRAASEGAPAGPLAGVPVGIKDIFDVAGLPTRLGAGPYAHYNPDTDSAAVARLRAAGAIILGKTHTTAFAMQDPAPTRNPWNLDHTPGGSSSGSAAGVAAGMIPLALGSQTVGSTLRPAAYCGVVGFKPSHGRISAAGVFPLAPSFDHIGIFSRSVADTTLALSVLAGFDAADPYSIDRPVDDYVAAAANPNLRPRIGLATKFYHGVADDEVARHIDAVAERLAAAGARVTEVEMPASAQEITDLGQPLFRAETAAVRFRPYSRHKEEYPPIISRHIEAGLAVTAVDFIAARSAYQDLRRALTTILPGYDVLLFPASVGTAPLGLTSTGPPLFNAPASFTGLPAIALPSGLAANGLPLSVQLMAGPFAEAQLLSAAAWVENLLDFHAEPALGA
ncbi:MAG: amidase [Dehalococcoidia bacterium]|nr:amidase [Dehalococcoidia bacterium]